MKFVNDKAVNIMHPKIKGRPIIANPSVNPKNVLAAPDNKLIIKYFQAKE